MRLETFFERFDLFADAPDSVAKMRELILELAVHGNLVPQDQHDEPACEQIARIVAAKNATGRVARTRAGRAGSATDGETASSLPSGWAAAPLANLVTILNGRAYSKDELLDAGTPVLRVGNLFTSNHWYFSDLELEPDKYCDEGDLIFAWSASFGPFIWSGPKVIYHYHIWKLELHNEIDVSKAYLYWFLQNRTQEIKRAGHGVSMLHMTKEKMERLEILLPPFPEQKRIVAKVEELMALCDRLEAQQQERETRHAALARASLARFADAPTPVNLDLLFHKSYSIPPADLRKSILTLAVQGKLVAQDPNDEPADVTVSRVARQPKPARFDRRSAARIQGIAALSVGPTEREVPTGWVCIPLIQIARLESGHTPSRSRSDWWGGNVSWVGVVDARLHDGKTIYETRQHTNEAGLANSAARLLPAGTVCVSRTASVGYVIILGMPMATSQDFVNWVPSEAVTSDWLRLVFTSEKDAFDRFSKGAVHQTIYYPEWLSMHTLLPPLAEQRRIVARVDELMALVDALESQLATAHDAGSQLVDAVVTELTQGRALA